MNFFKIALLSFSLFATTASAFPGHYTLTGYVTNTFGQPLTNMYVCVNGPVQAPVFPVTQCAFTDFSGFYAVSYPYTGTYLVSVQGYGIGYNQYLFLNFNSYYNFRF